MQVAGLRGRGLGWGGAFGLLALEQVLCAAVWWRWGSVTPLGRAHDHDDASDDENLVQYHRTARTEPQNDAEDVDSEDDDDSELSTSTSEEEEEERKRMFEDTEEDDEDEEGGGR